MTDDFAQFFFHFLRTMPPYCQCADFCRLLQNLRIMAQVNKPTPSANTESGQNDQRLPFVDWIW